MKSWKTTLTLAEAYDALGLNEKSVKSMPFEKLAMSMESPTVLQTTKALLDRLERRLVISHSVACSSVENVDHRLKRVSSLLPQGGRYLPAEREEPGQWQNDQLKVLRQSSDCLGTR